MHQICLSDVSGQALIDEDFLRTRGWTDFKQYRCDPNVEPPRIAVTHSSLVAAVVDAALFVDSVVRPHVLLCQTLGDFQASRPGEKDASYKSAL